MFVILRGAPPGSSGVDARLLRMTHVAPRPRPKFCGAPARRGRRLRPLRLDRALCALRAHSSAHFFAALRRAKSEPFVRIESRTLRCAAKSARCGARFCGRCADALTGGGLACAAFAFGALLRSTAGGRGGASFFPCADSCAPAGVCLRAPGSGFPGDVPATSWRRRSAAESSPDFPAFPAGWRKRHAAGKALTPARSRKRAECGRPGLPHSG